MPAGAVLCGGLSTRMGHDKATLLYDGVPMARRVADALVGGGCVEVVAVGGRAEELGAMGLEVVPDAATGAGPIGGLLAALHRFPDATSVVVVACDMPLLDPSVIRRLLDARGPADVAVAVTDRREPMCAAWRPSVAPALAAAVGEGERRIWRFLEGLRVQEVHVDGNSLRNMNRPSDLNG